MQKAAIVVNKFYHRNKLFDLSDKNINRDNCMYFFYKLKEEFKNKHIELTTDDIHDIKDSDIIIYNDMPENLPESNDIKKSYLLIYETDLIKPNNWLESNQKHFHKIFTWNDDYVDGVRFYKFNFSHYYPQSIVYEQNRVKKFTIIAGNKQCLHKDELYSKRLKIIQWFEKKHKEDFDLYGIGWDKLLIKKPFSIINKLSICRKVIAKFRPSYKGSIDSKIDILKKYKFAICFENATNINGYITEKIFDCFFAGCVPIYWGATNIESLIPSDCYIDYRIFKNIEEMYLYCTSLTENDLRKYQSNILKFLKSDMADKFNADYVAKNVVEEILGNHRMNDDK